MIKKYIIRRWTKNFKEEKANSLVDAIRIRQKMNKEEPGYCQIVWVPFRRRHPDFPLWFSIATLLIVIASQAMD